MTRAEDARREAKRRFPGLEPDESETTYPRSALPVLQRAAFVDGYLAATAVDAPALSAADVARAQEQIAQIHAALDGAEEALREATRAIFGHRKG